MTSTRSVWDGGGGYYSWPKKLKHSQNTHGSIGS